MSHAAEVSRLTPEQFKALARYKGWKFTMLAARWGVTPEWISEISRNPERDLRYDDALIGLPNLNRLGRDLKARGRQIDAALAKLGAKPDRPVPARPAPGYRYAGYLYPGAILTASADVGSMAEEGMRGVVFQVIDDGAGQTYGVIFESGMWDWFKPEHVDQYLATAGLTSAGAEHYAYRDETQLQDDFDAGVFDFWPAV
ncbi:hypothetical protein [Noviherbaspirillum denitrificans]|uniref:hypothetical protein n=1 Tax=Noviherbaspirillum denitrificans TaxID=1968433 RepID=UPI001980119D|nr:hypothetical protein [Noviherbaspirillum denitrificans]